MLITRDLDKLCAACIKHFDQVSENNASKIFVFSISFESRSIWGGNGDRDRDLLFYISPDGWVKHDITTEYGLYQKGDGVLESQVTPTTSSEIESYINGEYTTIHDMKILFRFYNKIRDMFLSEF